MLYEVLLWVDPTTYQLPDISYRASASSMDEAVLLTLRLAGLTCAAYVSVEALNLATPGTLSRSWGPVESTALQAGCEVAYG
jgi:hypothetical protein